MNYKKPQVVAKSVAKQSYVAGCPVDKPSSFKTGGKNPGCVKCERSGS